MHKAFTMVEILIVVVILGILAAIALPRFAGATDDARTAATQSSLAGVRSSIAAFRMNAVINGGASYPTLSALTDGTVLKFELPANPYTGIAGVQAVTEGQAESRTVVSPASAGWNYFVDNNATPPVVVFYANCEDDSTIQEGSGAFKGVNEL